MLSAFKHICGKRREGRSEGHTNDSTRTKQHKQGDTQGAARELEQAAPPLATSPAVRHGQEHMCGVG